MKPTSIDFSRQVAEGSRSSRLEILGSQLTNRSPYIKYTNREYYCITLLEYVNESQANVCVV